MVDSPSGWQIERAMSEAMQLRRALAGSDNIDDRAIIDTIDGETNVFALLDRLAEQAIADEALVERARERAQRLEVRAGRGRELILRMLLALELRRCERPLFTASVSHHTRAIVTDASAVPAEYQSVSPDLRALTKALHAGQTVPGAELSNEQPRLTLRTR